MAASYADAAISITFLFIETPAFVGHFVYVYRRWC